MQNKWIGYMGWTLGAVGLGASFYLISVVSGLRSDLTDKESLAAQFQAKLDNVVGENSKLSQTLNSLSDQLDSATEKIDSLESAQNSLADVVSLDHDAGITESFLENIPENVADLLDDENEGNALKEMMSSMAKRMQSPEMREMAAKMQVNMQYGDYLALFADDPEKQELLRSVLMEHSMEATANAMAMWSDEDGVDAALDNVMETIPIGDLMAEVLTPAELNEFEIYEEGKAGRMMRQSFDMQLNMMGSGISEESRQLIGDIFMEEWEVDQASPDSQSGGNPMGNQMELYERALVRSADYLTQTEYEQLESFIDYQQKMLEQFDFMNQIDGDE
jgi:hypothetical protein